MEVNSEYIAHISNSGAVQSVAEHSLHTAQMAEDFSVDALKKVTRFCGLLHDIGKYSNEFQRHIKGADLRVEHSICGAKEAARLINKQSPLTLLVQLCIAGHHSGLPDCGSINDTADMPTLYGRLKRQAVDYRAYADELRADEINSAELDGLLRRDCKTKADLIEKYAFIVRYCFSCLTDADSVDTRDFCEERPTEPIRCSFESCARALDEKLSGFNAVTELQAARQRLQQQAFGRINADANIFLMNMPTGSGKTLASMRCALSRIENSGGRLKRIIYVIPYNSIIDQTAETFEGLFSEHTDIIRHQSSFAYEEQKDLSEDYRIAARAACDNWDAGIIITTAVQFFESLYGDKRGKLRKVHNMANSVIVFDEAHLLPREYLEPCLRGITYITKYLGSEALFLTATMPDFRSLLEQCSEGNLRITDLIKDKSDFSKFKKCRFSDLGRVSDEELVQKASEYASSLIVVNSRRKAAQVFRLCSGEKYHLSTYMTAYDRAKVIEKIKISLGRLYEDFPDAEAVPPERRITVVSTSLIEAGVDLDFTAAFRELTGLDSVLQTGGRCNREGLRKSGEGYVFESAEVKPRSAEQELTKGLLAEFGDVSDEKAIKTYYDRLFAIDKEKIHAKSISRSCGGINCIPFRTYSENFRLVDDRRTVSIAVCRDEYSRGLYDDLCKTGYINSRKIRKYSCTVYTQEFEQFLKQRVLDDHGSGVFFLTDETYYDEQLGIGFEGKDYII